MKIVLTLLIRDEIDVVKAMIDYHFAQGVDQMIITDNGSVDGTYELCKELQKSLNIEVLTEKPSDFSQHRWVTKMANIAFEKYHADWVIHADADELFVPNEKFKNLKEFFSSISNEVSVLKIPRIDFVALKRPNLASPFLEMHYRKVKSSNHFNKPLPPKVAHRGTTNLSVSQGNHSVKGDDLNQNQQLVTEELTIYHYPLRSYKQFYSKLKIQVQDI